MGRTWGKRQVDWQRGDGVSKEYLESLNFKSKDTIIDELRLQLKEATEELAYLVDRFGGDSGAECQWNGWQSLSPKQWANAAYAAAMYLVERERESK